MTPDAIDLANTLVVNSPRTIADWAVTHTITRIEMRPSSVGDSAGLSFTFDPPLPESWKWPSNPANPSDNYQYTVWPVVGVGGRWATSGIIQMWAGRSATGAPLLTDFAKNWVYDARWAPMTQHQPVVGETMGFFVSAGNARGVDERSPGGPVTSVRERSNVVLIQVPPNDTGVFVFDQPAPPPVVVVPPPDEPKPPTEPSTPQWTVDELTKQVYELRGDVMAIKLMLEQVHGLQLKGLTGRIKFMGVTTTVTLKPPA